MTTKRVYIYDEFTGIFMMPYDAPECQLCDGDFIMPTFCTETPVPEFDTSTQLCKFDSESNSWVVQMIPVQSQPEIHDSVSNFEKRQILLISANARAAAFQAAVDLEIATDAEVEILRELKIYMIDLNRLDLNSSHIGWPIPPVV